MANKIKQNFSYILCAAMGLFTFIFYAIPYVAAFMESEWGSETETISGYRVMSEFFNDLGFSGVMCALLQIFILIVAVGALAYGVIGILNSFEVIKVGFVKKSYANIILFAYTVLNFLLLIFLIIVTATNTETDETWEIAYGIRFSAGWFITFIFGLASALLAKFGENIFTASTSQNSVFVCSKCGKKAKATDKFCNACGGAIEEKIIVKEEYACEKCGKKAKSSDRFCNVCGGAIKKVVVENDEYACEKCGKTAKSTDKFCSVCGGEIKKKETKPEETNS